MSCAKVREWGISSNIWQIYVHFDQYFGRSKLLCDTESAKRTLQEHLTICLLTSQISDARYICVKEED